jgi:hypothetical protein
MSLSKELGKLKYDKRLIEWFVSRGHFSKEDKKKYIDSLPDLAHNVEAFDLGKPEVADGLGNGSQGN